MYLYINIYTIYTYIYIYTYIQLFLGLFAIYAYIYRAVFKEMWVEQLSILPPGAPGSWKGQGKRFADAIVRHACGLVHPRPDRP